MINACGNVEDYRGSLSERESAFVMLLLLCSETYGCCSSRNMRVCVNLTVTAIAYRCSIVMSIF